jgi:sugar-specific transcriptional regulator TrmB
MSALTIKKMSWDEKLRAMEELWESLSREESRLESPAWHRQALREEKPINWAAAKQELRKRTE